MLRRTVWTASPKQPFKESTGAHSPLKPCYCLDYTWHCTPQRLGSQASVWNYLIQEQSYEDTCQWSVRGYFCIACILALLQIVIIYFQNACTIAMVDCRHVREQTPRHWLIHRPELCCMHQPTGRAHSYTHQAGGYVAVRALTTTRYIHVLSHHRVKFKICYVLKHNPSQSNGVDWHWTMPWLSKQWV